MFLEALQFPKMRNRNHLPIDIQRIESLAFRPARDFGVETFSSFPVSCKPATRPASRCGFNLIGNGAQALSPHREIAVPAKLRSAFCEQPSEKVVNLRHRSNGRFSSTTRHSLLNRDTARQSA